MTLSLGDRQQAEIRGQQAITKQRELTHQIVNSDNIRLNVDHKHKIKQHEAELLRSLASDFRDKQKDILAQEAFDKAQLDSTKVYAIDKFGNKIDNWVTTNGWIDYTNTWFHNALIVKHDSDWVQAVRYPESMQSADDAASIVVKPSYKHKTKTAQPRSDQIKAKLQRNSKQKQMESEVEQLFKATGPVRAQQTSKSGQWKQTAHKPSKPQPQNAEKQFQPDIQQKSDRQQTSVNQTIVMPEVTVEDWLNEDESQYGDADHIRQHSDIKVCSNIDLIDDGKRSELSSSSQSQQVQSQSLSHKSVKSDKSSKSNKLSEHYDSQSVTSNSQASSRHQISVTNQSNAVVNQIPWYVTPQTDGLIMFRQPTQQVESDVKQHRRVVNMGPAQIYRFLIENDELKISDRASDSAHDESNNYTQVKFEDWYSDDSDTSSDTEETKSQHNRLPTFKTRYDGVAAPDNVVADIVPRNYSGLNNNIKTVSESKDTLSSADPSKARQVVYSQNWAQQMTASLNPFQQHIGMLPESQSASSHLDSSSQFSDEFLNNDGYLTSSNNSSYESSSVNSSRNSYARQSAPRTNLDNHEISGNMAMSGMFNKSQANMYASGIYQNEL